MPSSGAIDAAYRVRLDQIKATLLAQIMREYRVDQANILKSYDAFARAVAPRIEAGQASIQNMAAAYVRGFVRAEVDGPIETAPMDPMAGDTKAGSLMDALLPIGGLILQQIAGGRTPDEAISYGDYLVSRTVDNEATRVADEVVAIQSQALPEIVGWEGIVNPDACDPCQENAGPHQWEEDFYRHPGCNCTKTLITNGIPGQDLEERAKVADEWGATAEHEAAVVRSEAVAQEPGISRFLQSLTDGVTGYKDAMEGAAVKGLSDLTGFEARVKGLESTARKIAGKITMEGQEAWAARQSIRDAVRYTIRTDAEDFVANTRSVVERLEAAGYRMTKWKPTFGQGEPYVGLNTFWENRQGYTFELQFHTKESFIAKELNHVTYEAQRVLDRTDPAQAKQWAEMDAIMASRSDSVPRPEDWETLAAMAARLTR